MKTVFVFSGAGLSAESGLKTFRDGNGLWDSHNVRDVCSPEGWQMNPKLVVDFYASRMDDCLKAEPNEAHKSLARLESKYKVVHYTQNVDNLLERAGCTDVYHLHGSLFMRKCENHFSTTMVKGKPRPSCEYRESQTTPVRFGDKCPKCDGQLRPDVVFFEEAVSMHPLRLKKLQRSTEVFVVIGTSAVVYPAALLVNQFSNVRRRYYVDKSPSRGLPLVYMEGNATEQTRMLVDKLLEEVAS